VASRSSQARPAGLEPADGSGARLGGAQSHTEAHDLGVSGGEVGELFRCQGSAASQRERSGTPQTWRTGARSTTWTALVVGSPTGRVTRRRAGGQTLRVGGATSALGEVTVTV